LVDILEVVRYNKHIHTKGAKMFTNCIAYAKLVYNKKLNAYKMQIAFNVHKKLVGEEVKYVFPVQKQCNYVSGDLLAEDLQTEVQRTIVTAQKSLRTTNIVFVD
jgi:hypothetical protein